MKRPNPVSMPFVLALLVVAALLSSSCNASGMGMGVGAPTKWGGSGGSGPPIFVGGPSF